MVFRRLYIGIFILCVACHAWAGGGIRFLRQAGLSIAPQEAQVKQLISVHMDRAVLNASRTARLAQHNRAAFFNSTRFVPFQRMATLSAPVEQTLVVDPEFLLQNDKLALSWFETIEKDLTFLSQQHKQIKQALRTQYIPPEMINYTALIPAQARKIYVGEEHNKPQIYKAFEQLVLQYQQAYPQRKLIILTEFVSDRLLPWQLPGRPVSRLEMPLRRNDKKFTFLSRLIEKGVEVIGLENVSYIKEHEALITPSEKEYHSVYGMQERNAHWRHIISYVAEKNPDAILFIYAGSLHTHYRAPFSLANPSPQNFVLQLESGFLGADMPFGFVMKEDPFTKASAQRAVLLSWPQNESVLRTRSGFDACIIFPKEKTP